MLLDAAEPQRLLAEIDGPADRGDELGRDTPHRRVVDRPEAVRQELGGREHVAQIVAHLADREPQPGKAALLLQQGHEFALHRFQFALGNADLVAPAAR